MDKKSIRKRTEEIIRKSAIVTEHNDFIVTHVPFKELKYCPSGISDNISRKYSEEELFNEFIIQNQDKHNFIVVQGDNGSGKSHFIRWLKYKYDNELNDGSEVSILIERNHNTLQGTIQQLLNNDVIKKFIGEEQLKKLSDAGENIATDKFLTTISLSFATEVMHEEDEDCILTERTRKKLSAFLLNETVISNLMTCKDGPIYRIGRKIRNSDENINLEDDISFTEEDFSIQLYSEFMRIMKEESGDRKAISFAEDLAEDELNIRSKVVKYLNSKINLVIQNAIKLNSQDLDNMIYKIRQELHKVNKDLTLFIEDITSFTGVDRAIIENLIVENTEENDVCRLFSVVGITNGYYKDKFPDNLKDRVTGRIVIDKESIFGSNEAILDIAARYINAIYLDKDIIKQWVKKGARDNDIPRVAPIKDWATYKDGSSRIFNIYPLSTQAIINLYEELEVKTPRNFISMILLPIFTKFTESDGKFPQGISELTGLIKIPEFNSMLINQKIDQQFNGEERERVKSFLRIWGNGTIDTFEKDGITYISGIAEEIYNEFDIPMIRGNNIEAPKVKVVEKEVVVVNQNPISVIETKSSNIHVEKEITRNEVESKEDREYRDYIDDIKRWKEDNQELKKHANIREFIVDFIKDSINWEMESVSEYLVDEALTITNFIIEGQLRKAAVSSNSYQIKKTDENYYFILALVEYNLIGKKKWNYKNATDGILTVSKWLSQHKNEIINYVRGNTEVTNDIYTYALLNNYYILELTKKDAIYKDKNLLYSNIITNKIPIEEDICRVVLGKYYKEFLKYKEEIKENNELVKRYYNCKLGDANVNITKTFYLDAKEIIEKLDMLYKNKFIIDMANTVDLEKLSDRYKLSYKLYKRVFEKMLPTIIREIFKEMIELTNQYKNIIGNEENIEETIEQINKFYKNLQNANIHYDNVLYNDFIKIFLGNYKNVSKDINAIDKVKNMHLSVKIELLKYEVVERVEKYFEVINKINALINKTYNDKKEFTEYEKYEKDLNMKKIQLYKDLEYAEIEIDKVNGGVADVIK